MTQDLDEGPKAYIQRFIEEHEGKPVNLLELQGFLPKLKDAVAEGYFKGTDAEDIALIKAGLSLGKDNPDPVANIARGSVVVTALEKGLLNFRHHRRIIEIGIAAIAIAVDKAAKNGDGALGDEALDVGDRLVRVFYPKETKKGVFIAFFERYTAECADSPSDPDDGGARNSRAIRPRAARRDAGVHNL